jgi:phage antirepressor YoqD-like protein
MITEYNNIRVLTTQQLADAYQTERRTISNNFNRNKDRYIVGKHFICLEGDDLREFKSIHQNDEYSAQAPKLYLWTEKGALLHAKSLNTDKAWEVYDYLVENYFKKEEVKKLSRTELLSLAVIEAQKALEEKDRLIEEKDSKIAEMKPKEIFADAVSSSKTSILIGELAKILKSNGYDTGEKRLFEKLRNDGYLISRKGTDYNMPTQRSMEQGLFEIKETAISHSDGHTTVSKTTKVTGKGQQYFINKFLAKAV